MRSAAISFGFSRRTRSWHDAASARSCSRTTRRLVPFVRVGFRLLRRSRGHRVDPSALLDEFVKLAVRRAEVNVALPVVFRRLVDLDPGRSKLGGGLVESRNLK